MIGASKILTVSYGTFSCTLEGFDEPFNTMKAIAEYFRDLAAEDRYFGAEPPTPDAAMLHRIAEREVHRRVEAKIQENGVILRAEAMPDTRAGVDVPVTPQMPTPAPRPVTPVGAPESVAAKLLRIRSAVAAQAPVAEVVIAQPLAAYDEDEVVSAPPAIIAQPPVPDATVQASATLPSDDVPASHVTADPLAAQARQDARWDLPIAANSDHLPEDTAPAQPEDALPEDIAAIVPEVILPEPVEAALPETVETEGARPVEEVAAAEADDDAFLASLGTLIRLDTRDAAAPETDTEAAPANAEDENATAPVLRLTPAVIAPDEDDTDAALNRAVEASVDDFLATTPAPVLRLTSADTAPADAVDAPDPAADPEPLPEEQAALSEKLQRARARVVKIRRIDPATEPARPLSPAAEADLARDLARATAEDPAPARPEGDSRKQLTDATGEAALERILEHTNSEMRGPETRRRMSALQHLKAAVAATVAERLTGRSKPAEVASRIDPYRNDLARVVRPHNPGTQAANTGERPAPLVLVSEQRVDRPVAPQPAQPFIRPRRVTSSTLAMEAVSLPDEDEDDEDDSAATDSRGFADFADKLGATALPDLLEAAAAFTECVEGRPYFSRPHLIRHLNAVAPDGGYSRESGLRSFGTLLRTGKIEKVKRGQFALTEASHLRAEARKIAP